MSRNMILVTMALALTVIWLGFMAFVHYVDRPDSPVLVAPDTVVTAVVLVVPIVLVWLAAAIMSYTSVQDDLWRLNNEVRNLRAALSHRVKLDGQPESGRSETGGVPASGATGRNSGAEVAGARTRPTGIPNSIIIRAIRKSPDFSIRPSKSWTGSRLPVSHSTTCIPTWPVWKSGEPPILTARTPIFADWAGYPGVATFP